MPSPPDLRYDTVSFLSDYGHADEFVGVVHSVIRQMCPGATVVDVTHEIPPYDVRAAGLTLARSAHYLCPGVVIAVVDPGVGSTRRCVAVEVGDGSSVLLGPDNGVLAPAVAMVGGATRAVWLNNPEYQLETLGPLFDGRDVFAPAAAYLCGGTPLEDLGEEVDPAGLLPGVLPLSRDEDGALVAEVLWVDRYGNVQLNLDPEELDAMGDHFEVQLDSGRRSARRADRLRRRPGIGRRGPGNRPGRPRDAAARGGPGRGIRDPGGARSPVRRRRTMRRNTTIAIVVLLLLIVGSVFLQLVVLAR